jgi:uncharacterized protein (TIGR02284 family)
MSNKDTIEVLNSLIEINNDRIAGYETALKETNEEDLKLLFFQFIQTSKLCNTELISEVLQLGGKPTEGTQTLGKLFRLWLNLKIAIRGRNRKSVLDFCEYGEDFAGEIYKKAIKNSNKDISTIQQLLLKSQYILIKTDYDTVKNLRDVLVIA